MSASRSTVLSPQKLAHVVLRTAKLKEQVKFYTDFLGAHVVHQNDFIAFITYDDEHHRLAFIAYPDVQPKVTNSAGLEHIAFTFDTIDDLAKSYSQRKALNILPVRCLNHGPTTSIYYEDLEGNQIEVSPPYPVTTNSMLIHTQTQTDNYDTVEEATAFMSSEAFQKNPIGIDFDPEDLVKRLASGEDKNKIRLRPDAARASRI